jgi:hypothetical protein
MITFDCPWCTEPIGVESSNLDAFSCDGCGITVEIAPDPAPLPIDRAA